MGGGSAATLAILEKIKELENRVDQLEIENELLLSSIVKPLTEAPSGGKVQFFSASKDINVASGKIPIYSKGVYIPNNSGNDAIIIASNMEISPKILLTIKNNGTWRGVREI